MNFLVFFFVKWYNFREGSDFLLSDNIRKYRKSKQMSQDELAEKLEVTRQSISLWETGQTQPSLDNIVALAKLFDVSTDALLTDNEPKPEDAEPKISNPVNDEKKKKHIPIFFIGAVVVFALVAAVLLWKSDSFVSDKNVTSSHSESVEEPANSMETQKSDESEEKLTEDKKTDVVDEENQNLPSDEKDALPVKESENVPEIKEDGKSGDSEQIETVNENKKTDSVEEVSAPVTEANEKNVTETKEVAATEAEVLVTEPEKTQVAEEAPKQETEKNIFGYLKDFVIRNGTVNGDYCYYSKSADNYGGYASENFSLYYWGDTDKIEFCLHSVMDDTFSINFYIYVPKKHTGDYKYISSYYYRDTGEPLYEAEGDRKSVV